MTKAKQPSRRSIGLAKIKFAGYHGTGYHILAIEYRISYAVALTEYYKGMDAKKAGVLCNCQSCKEALIK